MKKLLIAVSAAACALGAFATASALPSGTSFEGLTVGTFDPDKNDSGQDAAQSGGRYWYTAAEDGGIEATVMAFDAEGASAAHEKTRPDQFADESNNNYLNIESTSTTLYRTVEANTGSIGAGQQGIYIDTMVQFTAGDPTMSADDDAAKLAIWVCGNTEDGDPATETNFVVRAGQFLADGTFAKTNYVMKAVNADGSDANLVFNAGDWYRLTVKTIANVGTADSKWYAGYVVFVDGKMLVPASDDPARGTITYTGDYAAGVLPSMIDRDDNIAAVGFSGTGAIDDISFTTKAPDFADDAKLYTVSWGADIASVTADNGSIASGATFNAGSNVTFVAKLPAASTHNAIKWMTNTVEVGTGFSITTSCGAGVTLTPVAFTAAAKVGDAYYATLNDAFAKANGGTVQLMGDSVNASPLTIGSALTLDLAGCTITNTSPNAPAIAYVGEGELRITNSTVKVGVVAGPIVASAVKLYGGIFFVPSVTGAGFVDPTSAGNLGDGLTAVAAADRAGYVQIVVATVATPIAPGATSAEYATEAEATAAAAKVTVDTTDVADDFGEGVTAEVYQSLFEAKVTAGANGGYVVTVALKADVEANAQTTADDGVKAADLSTVATAGGTAEVDAVNGLYYSVAAAEELGAIDSADSEGARTMAKGGKVKLTFPKKGNKGFYKVKVNFGPKK